MITSLGRNIGERFQRVVEFLSQTGSVGIDQRLKLATVAEMNAFEKTSLVDACRARPLLAGDRFVEEPNIYTDELLVESEILSGGNDDVVAEALPDGVDRLIEGVTSALELAFRPEV